MRALAASRPEGGVTLVELLVTLVLVAGLSLCGTILMTGVAHAGRRAASLLADQRTLTILGSVLRHDLLDANRDDLAQPSAKALEYDRPIGHAPICRSDLATVWVARAEWQGIRQVDPSRDRAAILPVRGTSWLEAGITAVVTSSACPDGRPAWQFILDRVPPEAAYLRIGEPVHLSVYRSGANDWYGFAPADGGSAVQPFAGPLTLGGNAPRLTPLLLEMAGQLASGKAFSLTIPLVPLHGGGP